MEINIKSLKLKGDALADEAVSRYLESTCNKEKIITILDTLQKNRDTVPADLPDELKKYFTETETLPDWADTKKIKTGLKIFSVYGPEILMLLGLKSLPMAYNIPNGAKLLVMTGRFNKRDGNLNTLSRRVLETIQFVLDVLAPDSFAKNGRAIRSAQKVRLIHASIRYYIKQTDKWQNSWGVPLNQEYMLGTLMSFSALTLDGLSQVGVKLSADQKEAYVHLWNVVGYFLGIEPETLPANYQEADELGHAIFNSESGESEDGKILTSALLEYYEKVIPGNLFDGIPAYLLRYFVGDDIANNLGVKPDDNIEEHIKGLFSKIMFGIYNSLENIDFIRKLTKKYSYTLLEGMVYSLNDNKGINFSIPPSLRANWKVRNYWDNIKVIFGPWAGWRVTLQKEN